MVGYSHKILLIKIKALSINNALRFFYFNLNSFFIVHLFSYFCGQKTVGSWQLTED